MAKQCIFCGQPLPRDDAHFCNNCGRSQIPPPNAATSSAIKVKLPPKEFSRADAPSDWQENSWPTPMASPSRPLQSEQTTLPPARVPDRPMRQTVLGTPAQEKASGNSERSPFDVSQTPGFARPGASQAMPEEESTMVAPGWKEELASLRKEQPPTNSTIAPEKSSSATAQSSRSGSSTSGSRSLVDRLRAEREALSPDTTRSDNTPEKSASPADLPRRELRVKVWEQEPTAHLPQPSSEKPAADPGPAPAVEQAPFSGMDFGPEEHLEEIAALDTVLWPAAVKPVSTIVPANNAPVVVETHEEFIEDEEFESSPNGVEDQPTIPMPMPASAPAQAKIVVERASTPAPKNWPPAQPEEEEDVEDLPTKPLPATLSGPRSPISAAAPQPFQSQERPAQPNQPQATSAPFAQRPSVSNPDAQPGGPGPFGPLPGNPPSQAGNQGAFGQPNPSSQPGSFGPPPGNPPSQAGNQGAFGQPNPSSQPGNQAAFNGPANAAPGGRMLNPNSQPGTGFNQNPGVATLSNPPSSPGNAPQRLAPTGPGSKSPTTPRPEPTSVETALRTSARRRKPVRSLVAVLIILVLAGGGAFWWFYQPFTISPTSQPYQSYQNTALGFSLSYTQGWNVRTDQGHSMVHFADSSQTSQANLTISPATGLTLDQYVSQETKQLGIETPKTMPASTIAGASWQVIQGSTTQSGASYTITIYVTQHSNRFYMLACLAPAKSYADADQNYFSYLRSSFQFL